jgi:hypothetical protein
MSFGNSAPYKSGFPLYLLLSQTTTCPFLYYGKHYLDLTANKRALIKIVICGHGLKVLSKLMGNSWQVQPDS